MSMVLLVAHTSSYILPTLILTCVKSDLSLVLYVYHKLCSITNCLLNIWQKENFTIKPILCIVTSRNVYNICMYICNSLLYFECNVSNQY